MPSSNTTFDSRIVGVFSSSQNLIRCNAAMKLALKKAMKYPENMKRVITPSNVPPSFKCSTTIGRIEQMCHDLIQNKDPTLNLEATRVQEAPNLAPSPCLFDHQLTDSSDGEFWDQVDIQQETKLQRYHEIIKQRKKCFMPLDINETDPVDKSLHEETSAKFEQTNVTLNTLQEAKEQLRKASMQIQELYKAKDNELDKSTVTSQSTSSSRMEPSSKEELVVEEGPKSDPGLGLEELLSSLEAQEIAERIPVLPEITIVEGSLEQRLGEDSVFQTEVTTARIERIWFILQMSNEDKITMALEVIDEDAIADLNETLILWELVAAAVLHREHLLLQLQELRVRIERGEIPTDLHSLSMELCLGLIFATRHVISISGNLTNGLKIAGLSYPPNQALTELDLYEFYQWCRNQHV
eukprot:g746.t1